jgi:hypothetical protein
VEAHGVALVDLPHVVQSAQVKQSGVVGGRLSPGWVGVLRKGDLVTDLQQDHRVACVFKPTWAQAATLSLFDLGLNGTMPALAPLPYPALSPPPNP